MKLIDNQNELFDVVDENDNVIGKATRGQVHRNPGLIHRSVAIAVFNSKGELFVHQRSAFKDTDPLLWIISCSGHVERGDTYEVSARRELEEELGIKEVSLEFVTKFLYRSPVETEMAVLYKTVWDGGILLQSEEIKEGRFFTQKLLAGALSKGEITLSRYGKLTLSKLGWIQSK